MASYVGHAKNCSHRNSLLGAPRTLSAEAYERERQAAINIFVGEHLDTLLPSLREPAAAAAAAVTRLHAGAEAGHDRLSGAKAIAAGLAAEATLPARRMGAAAAEPGVAASPAPSPPRAPWSMERAAEAEADAQREHRSTHLQSLLCATAAPATVLPLGLTLPGAFLALPPFLTAPAVPAAASNAAAAAHTYLPDSASAVLPPLALQRRTAPDRRPTAVRASASDSGSTAAAGADSNNNAAAAVVGAPMVWLSPSTTASATGGATLLGARTSTASAPGRADRPPLSMLAAASSYDGPQTSAPPGGSLPPAASTPTPAASASSVTTTTTTAASGPRRGNLRLLGVSATALTPLARLASPTEGGPPSATTPGPAATSPVVVVGPSWTTPKAALVQSSPASVLSPSGSSTGATAGSRHIGSLSEDLGSGMSASSVRVSPSGSANSLDAASDSTPWSLTDAAAASPPTGAGGSGMTGWGSVGRGGKRPAHLSPFRPGHRTSHSISSMPPANAEDEARTTRAWSIGNSNDHSVLIASQSGGDDSNHGSPRAWELSASARSLSPAEQELRVPASAAIDRSAELLRAVPAR